MVMIGPQLLPGPGSGRPGVLQEAPASQAPAAGATALPPLRATWASAGQAVACGLNNQGNTCYMNSVLQCLAHLPPLANLCLERRHSSAGCRLRSSDAPCACCMVEAQISRMLNRGGCGGADTPHALYNSLRAFSKTFVPRRQEDAHELLRCLVDAMERDLLRNEGRYDPRKPLKNPGTVINQVFSGVLQSQVKCLSCGHESNTYDPFMDLSLELQRCASIADALRRFTATERLDGANKYRCDGCKQLVAADKRMAVFHDPNILVIHLKRFDGLYGKIGRDIAFDETLDLSPAMAAAATVRNGSGGGGARAGGRYQLHGVLIHEGSSPNSGHYTAYVRDAGGKWHCMNDSCVTRVSAQRVLDSTSGAYILFYVRTAMKALAPLPEHSESDGAAARAGAKRVLPAAAGEQQQPPDAKRRKAAGGLMARMIGPQLPPRAAAASEACAQASAADAVPWGSLARPQAPGTTRIGGSSFGTSAPNKFTRQAPAAASQPPLPQRRVLGEPATAAAPTQAVAGSSGDGAAAPAAAAAAASAPAAPASISGGAAARQGQQASQPSSSGGSSPNPQIVQKVVSFARSQCTEWTAFLREMIHKSKQQGQSLPQVLESGALRQHCRQQLPALVKEFGFNLLTGAATEQEPQEQ